MAYVENPNDSSGTKFDLSSSLPHGDIFYEILLFLCRLLGSLLNAAIFVAIIVFTTVVFVILYKYRCMKVSLAPLCASPLNENLTPLLGYLWLALLVDNIDARQPWRIHLLVLSLLTPSRSCHKIFINS